MSKEVSWALLAAGLIVLALVDWLVVWRRWKVSIYAGLGATWAVLMMAGIGFAIVTSILGLNPWGMHDDQISEARAERSCAEGYSRCLNPRASDYDCRGGSGDGPRYVTGPLRVTGPDEFGLDHDGDGIACDTDSGGGGIFDGGYDSFRP